MTVENRLSAQRAVHLTLSGPTGLKHKLDEATWLMRDPLHFAFSGGNCELGTRAPLGDRNTTHVRHDPVCVQMYLGNDCWDLDRVLVVQRLHALLCNGYNPVLSPPPGGMPSTVHPHFEELRGILALSHGILACF